MPAIPNYLARTPLPKYCLSTARLEIYVSHSYASRATTCQQGNSSLLPCMIALCAWFAYLWFLLSCSQIQNHITHWLLLGCHKVHGVTLENNKQLAIWDTVPLLLNYCKLYRNVCNAATATLCRVGDYDQGAAKWLWQKSCLWWRNSLLIVYNMPYCTVVAK